VAPEGWERSGVGWSSPATGLSSRPEDELAPFLGWPDSGDRAQLFADPADPGDPSRAVLVESGGGVVAQDAAGLTVRGQAAYESDPSSGSPWLMNRPDLRSVVWSEDGIELRATYALANSERARLRRAPGRAVGRSGGGFDAAADEDLGLLGEATLPAVGPTQVSVQHESGDGYRLGVVTLTATDETTVEYLTAWFYGAGRRTGRRPRGTPARRR